MSNPFNGYEYNSSDDPWYPEYGEESGMPLWAKFGLGCVVIAFIIIFVLSFTCYSIFGASNECKCTGSGGTWLAGTCVCPATLDVFGNVCTVKCTSQQYRDLAGKCVTCPAGKTVLNTGCIDDLSGKWLGYITSENLAVPAYDWSIKQSGNTLSFYMGATLSSTGTFDGTSVKNGNVTGLWNPATKRITWNNNSHWILQ